ncbi:hypothetical protein SOV_24770 [Sporomusa ovata DSM 2662]|nr:hypothetical protein SOV_4c04560 [Sporomusa ovata DSM 2662]
MAFSEKKSVRPIIKLPFTSTELILECIAVISLIFMIECVSKNTLSLLFFKLL